MCCESRAGSRPGRLGNSFGPPEMRYVSEGAPTSRISSKRINTVGLRPPMGLGVRGVRDQWGLLSQFRTAPHHRKPVH